MENVKLKKLIIYSSRSGGPYRQHHLLYKYLDKGGFNVEHWSGFKSWLVLHFMYGKNVIILTNVPLLFRFQKNNYFLNIHGNYNIEKNIHNPLGYLYDINIKWANKVVVPNVYLKKILKIKGAWVISNSIEKLEEVAKRKKQTSSINLICVTHFAFLKKSEGVLKIIESLKDLNTSKRVILNIFGAGKFLEKIKKESEKIELPKNINIVFRGFSKKINQELLNADIFVYWSNMDVMPTSLMEAMLVGLPIVTNNFAPFKEIIGTKNFLCNSLEEYRLGLEKMIDDNKYRKIAATNNLILSKKFLIENNINKWIRFLYEK